MRERILIVSDEQRNASIRESLAQEGFPVTITDEADDGYRQLLDSGFDLVVIDLSDPTEGLGLVKRVRANLDLKKVLILIVAQWGTGQGTMALTAGADGFEPAPVDRQRLVAAVTRLLSPNLSMTARASVTDRDDD